MTYRMENPAAAMMAGAPIRHGYTHFGNSCSSAPSRCSLLAFIAPMKKANETAFPRTTAADVCKIDNISMRAIIGKTAKKSMKGR